jgi:anti-sigma factor (TIGR02949 family)
MARRGKNKGESITTMESCNHFSNQMPIYLDDELHGDDREAFEAHLGNCPNCRSAINCERSFLKRIREASPIYQVPANLRARIEPILNLTPAQTQPQSELRRSEEQSVKPARVNLASLIYGSLRYRWMALVATLAIAIMLGAMDLIRHKELLLSNQPSSEFALLAVDTHLRHLRGQLPFEIVASSPEQISEWFIGKVPFGLKLPNYQESSGQEKIYEIEGARLVGFKKDYAAYVAYQMRKRPITLVVASNSVALPSGGEQVVSKGITFHYDSIDGLKVITWSVHGLTYALVSDLEERGQRSCMVCHAGTKDQNFIKNLRTSP